MNKTAKVIIAIIVLALVIGGALFLFMPKKSGAPGTATTGSSKTNSSADNSNSSASDPNAPVASTITYDGSTFKLSASTVKSGDKVKVTNSSASNDLAFDSDPHPVHTDDPELNAGNIAPGESKTFILTTKGNWGFHNHLDPSQHGNITVE